LHLFLLLGGLWLLICHGRKWWAVAASGVLFGLAVLTKSLLLPLLPVLLVFVVLVKDRDATLRARLIRVVLLAGVCLVTVTVLLAATAQQRGAASIAGSTVFNAWVGLNDSARVDTEGTIVGQEYDRFTAAGPDLAARNAVYRAKIGDLLRQQGVAQTVLRQLGKQYFRLFDVSTFLATQLPGQPRAAYAFEAPALAALLRIYVAVFQATVLVAGAIGMAWLRGRPLNWLHFFVVFILYNLAVFLVLHVTTRYVLQFFPMWIVFAATALYGGVEWLRSHQVPALNDFVLGRARLVVGIMLGIFMLLLSFHSLLFGR
jgi:4-amino-4-deoxy-L-arabinose transferase-like glycosyltransferase